jgi:hypothetical protein
MITEQPYFKNLQTKKNRQQQSSNSSSPLPLFPGFKASQESQSIKTNQLSRSNINQPKSQSVSNVNRFDIKSTQKIQIIS